jgi:hypothetical protein
MASTHIDYDTLHTEQPWQLRITCGGEAYIDLSSDVGEDAPVHFKVFEPHGKVIWRVVATTFGGSIRRYIAPNRVIIDQIDDLEVIVESSGIDKYTLLTNISTNAIPVALRRYNYRTLPSAGRTNLYIKGNQRFISEDNHKVEEFDAIYQLPETYSATIMPIQSYVTLPKSLLSKRSNWIYPTICMGEEVTFIHSATPTTSEMIIDIVIPSGSQFRDWQVVYDGEVNAFKSPIRIYPAGVETIIVRPYPV